MQQENTEIRRIPQKLTARRVLAHVGTTLEWIQRPVGRTRDARRVRCLTEITWANADLYTLAYDIAPDEDMRFLVGQARGAILAALVGQAISESEIVSVPL